MMLKKEKGFTLIELMIVVAIIGILAAVAIPKFADLVDKAKEASAKGDLSAVRSALSIYYGQQEGEQPVDSNGALYTALVDTYVKELPEAEVPKGGHTISKNSDVIIDSPATDGSATAWGYYYSQMEVVISCTHTDTKGQYVHATW